MATSIIKSRDYRYGQVSLEGQTFAPGETKQYVIPFSPLFREDPVFIANLRFWMDPQSFALQVIYVHQHEAGVRVKNLTNTSRTLDANARILWVAMGD